MYIHVILCADVMVVLIVVAASSVLSSGLKIKVGSTVDEVMNTCMDGRNHKTKPGPESKLFQHVSWQETPYPYIYIDVCLTMCLGLSRTEEDVF